MFDCRFLHPSLRLLGHVVTRVDRRLLVHRAYEQKLREIYGDAVFQAVIPEASAFKVAISCRKTVNYQSPNSKAAHSIQQLVAEIQLRIAATTNKREVA